MCLYGNRIHIRTTFLIQYRTLNGDNVRLIEEFSNLELNPN